MTWSDAARAAAAEARRVHAKGIADPSHPLMKALRTVMTHQPWGNSRVSRKVGRYLGGDTAALKDAPTLRRQLDKATLVIKMYNATHYRRVK